MISLMVNGKKHALNVSPDTPVLWILRDHLGLTGTKFGCGMALCGACTVHLEGRAIRSCVTPLSAVAGKRITTIEGLKSVFGKALQRAWIAQEVPQCGYCQPGMIMSASAMLAQNPAPDDAQIDSMMSGHICRCGTYKRIRRAIHRAAAALRPRVGPMSQSGS